MELIILLNFIYFYLILVNKIRLLTEEQKTDVNGHKNNTQNNGSVKQPFFKTATGLHNVAAAAKNVGKPGRFVLQGNYNNQQKHY